MTKTGIKIIRKDTAKEFLDYLRLVEHHWTLPNQERCEWVFRGQANECWKLQPSAMRNSIIQNLVNTAKQQKLYKHIVTEMYNDPNRPIDLPFEELSNRLHELYTHVELENELVFLFVQHCDRTGLAIPEDKAPFNTGRGYILDLMSQAKYNKKGITDHRLELLGRENLFYSIELHVLEEVQNLYRIRIEVMLAQHHGVPTRLLDWTIDPLIAAYFAASNPIHWQSKSEEKPKQLAVWAIYPPAYRHSDLWFDQPYTSKIDYLRAQKGLFSVDLTMSDHFLRTKKWRTIDEIPIENKNDISNHQGQEIFINSPLVKLTLPTTEISELVRLLEVEGINEATLKPSFDSVGNYLNQNLTKKLELRNNGFSM